MRVIVIGAGIGGLALACGLRRNGIDVTVFERDRCVADTGGYHLHLHARALAALRRLLSPDVLEQIYGSAADGAVDLTSVMRDRRGRRITTMRTADDGRSLNIDRVTLRTLLAHTVSDAVEWSATYVGFATSGSGAAEVRFDGGGSSRADVVVGADGASSLVARQLSGGRPASVPLGLVGIGGATPLAAVGDSARARLRQDRTNFALGPERTALYIGYHDPINRRVCDVPLWAPPATREPTYIWGAMVGESPETRPLLELSGARLRAAAAERLDELGWAPGLTTVLANSGDTAVAAFRIRAAADPGALAPWSAGPVCAIGDAVHAVPPTGGQGASTAILDADALCTGLTRAARGDTTVALAVEDFHATMRTYARAAVEDSLKPVTWMTRASTPPGRLALSAASGVAALRDTATRGIGRFPDP